MSLENGTRLGSYEILAPIGASGMGEVYRGRDHKLERDVAIKVLPEDLADDRGRRERFERFEREARAASALNHPNIITIHDIGSHGSSLYMVMELVSGKTLRALFDEGPVPPRMLVRLARQLAGGTSESERRRNRSPRLEAGEHDGNRRRLYLDPRFRSREARTCRPVRG